MLNKWLLPCAVVWCWQVSAQLDTNFLQHLDKAELRVEQITYLEQFPSTNDTVAFHQATFYFHYFNEPLFRQKLAKSTPFFLANNSLLLHCSSRMLNPLKYPTTFWFDSVLPQKNTLTPQLKQLQLIYTSSLFPENYSAESFPDFIRGDFRKFQRANTKKPYVAAILSSVLPGTGKLYIGSKKSFLMTLLSLSIMGLQAAESYSKLGIQHPLTLINLGFFCSFYGANIVGSFRETNRRKKELRIQYLLNASTYYQNKYPASLY